MISTHLGTRVLSLLSLEFGVKLSLILTLDPFRFFFVGKNLFSNIVPTKFRYNWSRFILTSLLFLCSVRSIQICRWNSMFIFVDIISIPKSSVTLLSVSTIPWTRDSFGENTAHAYLVIFRDFQLSYSLLIDFLWSSWFFVLFLFFFSHPRQILWI